MLRFALVLALLVAVPLQIEGHGMVMDPVNRASRWRVDPTAPTNWDDNQLYCGSYGVSYKLNFFYFLPLEDVKFHKNNTIHMLNICII